MKSNKAVPTNSRRMRVCSIYMLLLCILSSMAIGWTSCSNDDDIEETGGNMYNQKLNEWVYEQMSFHYYWNKELPPAKSLDFNITFSEFYKKIKYQGDRFSYYKSADYYNGYLDQYMKLARQYGVEYQMYESPDGKPVARALLVDRKSPLSGLLRRGDWFRLTQNGQQLDLLAWDSVAIQKGKWRITENRKIALNSFPASRAIYGNDVYMDSIYHINGHRIGYIHYKSYGDMFPVATTLEKFHQSDITEAIIDLRYNGGGYLNTAIYLSTAFIPEEFYEKPAQYLVYNENVSLKDFGKVDSFTTYYYKDAQLMSSLSSHPTRVYFLVGNNTASASESTIKMIQAHMPITLIGDTTVGKGVGMYDISDPNYPITLVPITFRYYNSQWETVPDSGLVPDYFVPDGNAVSMKEIGSLDEPLLSKAIELILQGDTLTDSIPAIQNKNQIPQQSNLPSLRPMTSPSTTHRQQGLVLDKNLK